jgi:hypothetical protein
MADFTADDDYYAGMLAMVEKAGIMRFCDIEAEASPSLSSRRRPPRDDPHPA